jgi:hypothetical protein
MWWGHTSAVGHADQRTEKPFPFMEMFTVPFCESLCDQQEKASIQCCLIRLLSKVEKRVSVPEKRRQLSPIQ